MIKLFFGSRRDKQEFFLPSFCRNIVCVVTLAPCCLLAAEPGESLFARGESLFSVTLSLGKGGYGCAKNERKVTCKDIARTEAEPSPHRFLSLYSDPDLFTRSDFSVRLGRGTGGASTAFLCPEESWRPEIAPFFMALTLEIPAPQTRTGSISEPSAGAIWETEGEAILASPFRERSDEPEEGFFFAAQAFQVNASAGREKGLAQEADRGDSPLTQVMQTHTVLPYRLLFRTEWHHSLAEEKVFDRMDFWK
jgi:hypothetical protein